MAQDSYLPLVIGFEDAEDCIYPYYLHQKYTFLFDGREIKHIGQKRENRTLEIQQAGRFLLIASGSLVLAVSGMDI